jgi:modulator of FtsH protease HflC
MSIVDTLRRNPLAWLGLLAVLVALFFSVFLVVPETKQALILKLGKPDRIANPYDPHEDYGRTGAGIVGRLPFVERVVWIDKRVLDFDMSRQAVLSTDQLRLEVDAYARFRIVDPVRMYVSAGSERRVAEALRPILGSALRNELGKRPFADLLSPERSEVMERIRVALARVARQYGAEIIDVRIKRADLPDGTPLQSAFERMRTARQQEARSIRAEGRREAQIMIGEADAQAAKTYADSFGKDPAFYDFYRAMQSYRMTFGTDDANPRGPAQIILGRDSDYLRQFNAGGQSGRR